MQNQEILLVVVLSAEVVGRIIARDFNLNLVTDGSRKPLSNPNSPA
jgi:hypothetical protein